MFYIPFILILDFPDLSTDHLVEGDISVHIIESQFINTELSAALHNFDIPLERINKINITGKCMFYVHTILIKNFDIIFIQVLYEFLIF